MTIIKLEINLRVYLQFRLSLSRVPLKTFSLRYINDLPDNNKKGLCITNATIIINKSFYDVMRKIKYENQNLKFEHILKNLGSTIGH